MNLVVDSVGSVALGLGITRGDSGSSACDWPSCASVPPVCGVGSGSTVSSLRSLMTLHVGPETFSVCCAATGSTGCSAGKQTVDSFGDLEAVEDEDEEGSGIFGDGDCSGGEARADSRGDFGSIGIASGDPRLVNGGSFDDESSSAA